MSDQTPSVLLRHEEAEQSVLGGILVNAKAFYDVAGTLTVEHFAVDANRRIYAAMLALARQNKPIDPVSVHAAVASPDVPFIVIDKLTDGVPRSTNVGYYATLVVNAAKLRAAVQSAADVVKAATTPGAQAVDVLEQAQASFFALAGETVRKSLWWADEMTPELAMQFQHGPEATTDVPSVLVGLPDVDARFDGFEAGDLAFLAGRPSTGKTCLAQQIALTAAEDRTVLSIGLEMRHTAMWRRALATVSGVHIPKRSRRPFTEHEETLIGRGLAHLGGLQMAIEDVERATPMRILSTARRVQMQRGLGLIVIDYLQLMRSDNRHRTRGEELGEITRTLKEIAMQLEVPVLVLAALSRDAANERPKMAHIRECGTAEYDADHIFLMHRNVDDQKDLEPGQASEAELIIEKQRNGPTGSIPLLYMGETYRFLSKAVA
jgi:replicative DNA helicase